MLLEVLGLVAPALLLLGVLLLLLKFVEAVLLQCPCLPRIPGFPGFGSVKESPESMRRTDPISGLFLTLAWQHNRPS